MALTQEKLEYQRNWRRENPEKYREQQKRTQESRKSKINSDFEYFLNYTYKSLEKGAAKRGYEFSLSIDDLREILLSTDRCNITGEPLVFKQNALNKASIDRIDNDQGYYKENVHVVTSQVNRHRLDSDLEEFFDMCCKVAEHLGWQPPVDKKQE